MKLFYSPGACSLAPHIVLQEVGNAYATERVDLKKHQYSGGDYYAINRKGSVPALQLDDGELLTENAVVLQYIADKNPNAKLIPTLGSMERYRAQEWLNFVATELHKSFGPLWNPASSDEMKTTAKETIAKKFNLLNEHLGKNSFMLGSAFSAVDAYVFTILNWANIHKIEMSQWPALVSYFERIKQRPAVQATLKAEGLT